MDHKKIRTVLGDIEPADVGMILPHEHLAIDYRELLFMKPLPQDAGKEHLPLTMENLGWIRQHPYSHLHNLNVADQESTLIDEFHYFKKNGGTLVVDVSNRGKIRNLEFPQKAARETGVHFVAGTGYYVEPSHPAEVSSSTEEELAAIMMSDITEGVDGVKCGVIGEIGCSWPLTENERKVLRAAAVTQTETGAPVIIHPGRDHRSPPQLIQIFQEAGGNLSKTVMAHLDRSIHTDGELLDLAETGCICEHDLFGIEVSSYDSNRAVDMPSDAERLRRVRLLVEAGYEDQVTISQDVHTKHRLMKFGGHGYSHILLNVVPKMRDRGFSEELIHKITMETPRKWLQF